MDRHGLSVDTVDGIATVTIDNGPTSG